MFYHVTSTTVRALIFIYLASTALISTSLLAEMSVVSGLQLLAQAEEASDTEEIEGLIMEVELLNDTRLVTLCVIGAIAGAFLAVAIWAPASTATDQAKVRSLTAKFGASMIAGANFTPVIIRLMDWPCSSDVVLGVSTAVAMVAVAFLHSVIPVIEKAWSALVVFRLKKWFGDDQNKDS